jgi:ABC-type uncharacterized transport system involved in gliding motility auxiliary subunit
VTNALIKVTREGKKTVCFAEGEGERDPEDSGDRGYSAAKGALTRGQYEVKKVLLLRETKVPEDCTVLVVPGPEKDLLPPAVDAIRSHVAAGGKALVMVEPETKGAGPYANLAALLKEWNVELKKDVVIDVSLGSQLAGTGPFTPLAAQYPYHEITKDFRLATAFHTARSAAPGQATVEGVSAQSLVETSKASWAESDLALKEPIEMNPDKDQAGPISLAAVVTVRPKEPEPSPSPSPSASPAPAASPSPAPEEEKPTRPEGRIVVVGDADFASNQFLGFPGNQDFFLNTVAWLSEDADLISIRPKDAEDQRMFLTRAQQDNVFYLSLVVIPGFFVAAGVWTWWRRR